MRKNTLLILFLVITLISCSNRTTVETEKFLGENYVPENLEEALNQIDFKISDSLKTIIKTKSEKEFLSETHFGLGLGMRNNWKLWKGSSLSSYFNDIGIFHPDDMSSIILTSYHRKITNNDIKLDEQIAFYKEYWDGVELTRLPEKSEHPEQNLEFRVSVSYDTNNKNKKWETIYIQTNSQTEKFWIYDYYYGWKQIDLKTKQKLDDYNTEITASFMNEIFK